MSVNLYHDFYTSEWKFIMMQYFKDVTRSDLYCYALVFKDISRRYALCSSFYFSFPRVLSSCLCSFCLNPLFWLPTDLEVLCTFLGTGALVFLMLPCIYFPPPLPHNFSFWCYLRKEFSLCVLSPSVVFNSFATLRTVACQVP